MFRFKTLTLPGKLIYINVVIFALTQLWRILVLLLGMTGYAWQDALALHSNLHDFSLRPWTLFTYMWTHADIGDDIFHIIFNMLWLWWFGNYFMRSHRSHQFIGVYLMGGLAAGLSFLLVYNIFPYFSIVRHYSTVVGASGAIFALIVAVAMSRPNDLLYLNFFVRVVPVRMKWFALSALGITLLSLGGSNTGGIVCHLGGALFGYLYGALEQRGIDLTLRPTGWWESLRARFSTRPRMTATPGGARHSNVDRRKDMDYNARQRARQERIDAILDKISKHGYDGLTAEEKQTLFDASKRK